MAQVIRTHHLSRRMHRMMLDAPPDSLVAQFVQLAKEDIDISAQNPQDCDFGEAVHRSPRQKEISALQFSLMEECVKRFPNVAYTIQSLCYEALHAPSDTSGQEETIFRQITAYCETALKNAGLPSASIKHRLEHLQKALRKGVTLGNEESEKELQKIEQIGQAELRRFQLLQAEVPDAERNWDNFIARNRWPARRAER